MNDSVSALHNWVPYKLFFEEEEALCKWMPVGDKKFTEPFFQETISKCRQLEYDKRRRCVSNTEVLPEWALSIESILPSAFIFHVSRCGSTLASQLLAVNSSAIVLSEVPFFDELLRWKKKVNAHDEESMRLLSAAMKFYGAKRNNEDHLFIKTDSWHIFFYSIIRRLYPHTPFILLYRRPDEVIRSQQKRRGMQSIPALIEPELFGFDKNEILDIHLDEYMARVLEKYFETFLDILQKDPLAFPVNYNKGAIAIVKKIADISGISIPPGDMDQMKQRAIYHAKYPQEIFAEKTVELDIPSYCKRAFALYEAVEEIRINRVLYAS